MIGNDVVDLNLARVDSNWKRHGFLAKVFSSHEQKLIASSKEPFFLVWRLWSMKESAYKFIVQKEKRRFFSPAKLECEIISAELGQVKFENYTIQTNTSQTSNYLFTTTNPQAKLWFGPKLSTKQRMEVIAEELRANVSELTLIKTSSGAPNIFHNGHQLTSGMSITHHGNYEAFQYYRC